MVDFAQAVRDYVRFGYCTSLGNIATFGEIFGGGGSGIGEFGVQAARFLHNAVCNTPAPQPDPASYTGGQCDGVEYNVTGRANYSGSAVPGGIALSGVAIGPVSGITYRNVAGNSTLVFAIGKPLGSNTTGQYGIGSVPTSFGGGNDFTDAILLSATRRDGLPDTCGNPPGTIPPYVPGSNTVSSPVTYTNSDGDDVTVPVTINLGYAQVNVNGELNVPFTLNVSANPTVNIAGEFNLNTGDVNFNAGNPALPPAACGGNSDDFSPSSDDLPPTSPTSPNVPDPNPDPDKPEKRKLLLGCLVTTTVIPKTVTEVFQTGNPNVYAPDLGLVSFQVSLGGYTGWTEDIRVKNLRQFIPCPWKGGAIAVRGTARAGGVMQVTPIYETVTLGQSFPA